MKSKKVVAVLLGAWLAVCLFSTGAAAEANFYVIAAGKTAKRTVLVSPKETATASGAALLSALASITGAGESNPYLLKIEPGIYDIRDGALTMKPYVDVEGSGEVTTKILGHGVTVVATADHTELRFLTVENQATVTNGSAVRVLTGSPKITHLTAIATASNMAYPFYNAGSSTPLYTDVKADAQGGTYSYGIYNNSSSPTLINVTITSGSPTAVETAAIYSYTLDGMSPRSTVTIKNGSFEASGGAKGGSTCYGVFASDTDLVLDGAVVNGSWGATYNYGVFSEKNSRVRIFESRVSAVGGLGGYGVLNANTAGLLFVERSYAGGASNSVRNDSQSAAFIGSSKLSGVVTGLVTCANVYDNGFTAYTNTCP